MDIKYIATLFFALSLLHSFCVSIFAKLSKRQVKGSLLKTFFHLMAEVEVVFGFWAFWFFIVWALQDGITPVIAYQKSLNMTEPLFIFCIMILASSKPIVHLARKFILFLSQTAGRMIPVPIILIQFFILLTVGPLLGSLITEPAAITIIALLLARMIEKEKIDVNLLYGILALLFVNVSVGGGLTHFAAPPILMVAHTWNWGLKDVFFNLGEAAISTVLINVIIFTLVMKQKIAATMKPVIKDHEHIPFWLGLIHILFLAGVVYFAHEPTIFFSLFLVFLVLTNSTKKHQEPLKYKQAFLVGFFLAGLIVFGAFQSWWLEPLIQKLSGTVLYFSSIGLTAVTDNAALTYLGSQVASITETSKWALVSGALAGGGLTILANAPNPAGFSILSLKFEDGSLNAGKLFLAALLPTGVAAVCFYFLGKF